MSVPDPTPARKPNRWGLYAPFLLVLVAIAAWSGAWLWLRGQTAARMDAGVAAAQQAGYRITWKARVIGGYPFRLDVTLTDASLREPSGWALDAPRIEAEAYAYAPTSWLIAATQGLTFVRPEGGPVAVKGELIRASLSHFAARPPSFSFEGVKLAFEPAGGARPFWLAAADRVEFHLRAGPDDEGGVFASVAGGRTRPGGLFARIAGDRPVSLEWNSTLSRMSAFAGRDWPDAVRRWSAAGGRMSVRKASLIAGEAQAAVTSGTLGVGRDGRLVGTLDANLRQAPRALAVMAEAGVMPPETAQTAALVAQARQDRTDLARTTIDFQAGRTTLGPVAVGPAPKVYDLR
jgi:hypothetical protein